MSSQGAPSAATAAAPRLRLRRLGRLDYHSCYRRMREFTERRSSAQPDELWLTEHEPVFTLGLNARREHLLAPGDIPVVATDRGGQVTYHGPGQLLVYCLFDLRRSGLGVRSLVSALEQTAIGLLAGFGIEASARADAPGVYVAGAKIASLGLRVRRGCSYHGLSLNVAMDLEPFTRIDPCGYRGLRMTQLRDFDVTADLGQTGEAFCHGLAQRLGYRLCETRRPLPTAG